MTPLNRFQMAWRAAQDIEDGMVVNLGIGIPVLSGDYVPKDRDVFIQAENGIIGCGPLAAAAAADADLVDAGSRRITLRPGAASVGAPDGAPLPADRALAPSSARDVWAVTGPCRPASPPAASASAPARPEHRRPAAAR